MECRWCKNNLEPTIGHSGTSFPKVCLGCGTPTGERWEWQELRATFDAANARIKELEKERDSMAKRIVHCDNCGGSWYDDGHNAGCACRFSDRIKKLEEKLASFAELEKAAIALSGGWGHNGPIQSYMDDLRKALVNLDKE